MSPLLIERLSTFTLPFFYCGFDYFGPILIKFKKHNRTVSGNAKRYGALFTCMSTRAIHLELAGELSTDSFIHALRRFISRKDHPKQIRTDNGTISGGAERKIKEALRQLQQCEIADNLNENNIKWYFNPPSSPWMEGAMESLVKITKNALREL